MKVTVFHTFKCFIHKVFTIRDSRGWGKISNTLLWAIEYSINQILSHEIGGNYEKGNGNDREPDALKKLEMENKRKTLKSRDLSN